LRKEKVIKNNTKRKGYVCCPKNRKNKFYIGRKINNIKYSFGNFTSRENATHALDFVNNLLESKLANAKDLQRIFKLLLKGVKEKVFCRLLNKMDVQCQTNEEKWEFLKNVVIMKME
jgi:hypothetical protein